MHGAAVSLVAEFKTMPLPDLILATDMLDLATFRTLAACNNIPCVLYMHENQLAYPWSDTDPDKALQRDHHYGFINYTSCLAADHIWWNSAYNMNSFLHELSGLLNSFPDHSEARNIDVIRESSVIMPLGVDPIDRVEERSEHPVILWNHRWEYDKDPDAFFRVMRRLKADGHLFRLIVLGERYERSPEVFKDAATEFREEIIHWGFADSADDYRRLVGRADVLPVTSRQDFFGISMIEAASAGVYPILPKRLAFPEHFPESDCYYTSEDELYAKLVKGLNESQDLSEQARRYDWRKLIGAYDAAFDSVLLSLKDHV